jgi:hypothetical protein
VSQTRTDPRLCRSWTDATGVAAHAVADHVKVTCLGRGFQEVGEAAGKWRRALLTSTQLSTYCVGYNEVAAIAAARPFVATPKAWHDAMLAHGSPPPRHLRALLGI